MENYFCLSEKELKAAAFDFLAEKDNATGLTVEAESAIYEFVSCIINLKGAAENGK